MKSEFILTAFEKSQHDLTVEAFRAILEEMYGCQKEVEREIEAFVREYGRDGVVTYAEARKWVSRDDHRRRMTALLLTISALYVTLFGKISKTTGSLLNTIAENEYRFYGLKPEDGKIAKILEKPWGVQEMSWEQHIDEYKSRWNSIHSRDLTVAFLRRDGIDKILKDYRKQAEREQKIIKTLLDTESSAIGTSARAEILKELGETRYQIFTRVDERRCDTCASMHGMIFPFSAFRVGETAPPFHARCRCWIKTVD